MKETLLQKQNRAGMELSRDFVYLLRDSGIEVPESYRVSLDHRIKELVSNTIKQAAEELDKLQTVQVQLPDEHVFGLISKSSAQKLLLGEDNENV